MTVNRIEAEAEAAVTRTPAGHGRRPVARARIEARAAAAAAQAAEAAMGELYANKLIACLDAEGLGSELTDDSLQAVLAIVRSLEGRALLPQRQPNGAGQQPAPRPA